MTDLPDSVDAAQKLLQAGGYIADRELATVVFLGLSLGRPMLFEGEAGVGKTEIAKVLAATLGRDLIRLQCFEGLDMASAAYEWDYPRQITAIRIGEATGNVSGLEKNLYSEEFLIERPLLSALRRHEGGPPVLLIDELDRADEPFEAFLLEVLSDFQLSIPELGTFQAEERPIVVITSNRTRDVHDALRRRCLYHWVAYPDRDAELRIVALKAGGVSDVLRRQLVEFVQRLRQMDLYKPPGVAEAIDWAQALERLDVVELDGDIVDDSLGSLLKYQDDLARVRGSEAERLIQESRAGAA